MSSLLIRDVLLRGQRTNIFCENGRISAIDGEEHPADSMLDGRGMIAHPPLINAHTHASMTLFRGNGDDLPLMEWLTKRVWPYERGISPDEVYWGARLAILEMIRAGTVFFNDMYWDFHAVAKAVEETGVRAMIAAVLLAPEGTGDFSKQVAKNEQLYEEAKRYSDRVQFAVAPHAIYTVSEEALRWSGEFSKENNLVLHTHLSETEHEVKECYEQHGCSPVEYLERLGMMSDRLVAAHTVWLSEKDIAILGEHKATCVHNPVSNMKLAVNGVYPYRKLQAAGAVTAIATDGAGSNNNLDMFEEMKIAALLQKFKGNDPTAITAKETLDMAVKNPAKRFGLDGNPLQVGGLADLILINPDMPELNPMHDLASHLVYAANGSVVDSVVCDGRVLMEHRNIEGEDEVLAKAREASASLFARVDETNQD
ncbi:amidohydrolase [bacterium]|nr:amidohydrolase [bacterium]